MSEWWEGLPRPIALVCGAGVQNAAAQVGMMSAMCRDGWRPDFAIACSAGSVTAAALIADRDDPAALAEEMWLAAARSRGARFGWPQLAARLAGREWSRVTPDWRGVFSSYLGNTQFPEDAPHALIATDVGAGRE